MIKIKSQAELSKAIKEEAKNQGFDLVRIAVLPASERLQLRNAALQRWLNKNHHADMKWMEAPKRQNIESMLEGVKSILSVGLNYYVKKDRAPNSLSIARYAWGKDYHKVLQKRLNH